MKPLLVLRPEPGASATAEAAAHRGLRAIVAPLFTIRPIELDRSGLATPDALLLTSANAARALGSAIAPLATLPVYAVGEATATAARAAGFGAIIVGGPDAAATVARSAEDGVRRLLHLAGREHRVTPHPFVEIDRRVVYAADAAATLPLHAVAAMRAGAVSLLHSPRAATLFARLVAEAALPRGPIATFSPAIAAAAGPGWASVAVAAEPTDAALLAAAARLCEEAGDAHADRP